MGMNCVETITFHDEADIIVREAALMGLDFSMIQSIPYIVPYC